MIRRLSRACTVLAAGLVMSIGLPAIAGEPVTGLGDTLQLLIPASGYVATWFLDDEEGRDQFCRSYGTSFAITHILKLTVNERRPNGNNTASFPSGHTSSAFQGASFIQQRYGWSYGLPAYLGAAYTGWSRVELGAHYSHDVFAGAAVGILSSYMFTTPYGENSGMGLFYEEGTIGFQMNWKW